MTTLYKPVLIESAEQAEALPDDTVAIRPQYFACEKHCGTWRNTDAAMLSSHDLVGFTALVPIEAEEEHRPAHWMDAYYPNAPKRMQTRYVTPWEPT